MYLQCYNIRNRGQTITHTGHGINGGRGCNHDISSAKVLETFCNWCFYIQRMCTYKL